MAEEIRQPDGQIEHPTVRYERTDVSFRGVLCVVIAAAVVLAIVHVAILGFFVGSREDLAEARRSKYPLAPGPSTDLPPEPRLEQLDRHEATASSRLPRFEKVKAELLHRYGRADEDGFVYIPIDRAMKMLANKLPARAAQDERPSRANGLVGGGEPNSGRLFKKGGP